MARGSVKAKTGTCALIRVVVILIHFSHSDGLCPETSEVGFDVLSKGLIRTWETYPGPESVFCPHGQTASGQEAPEQGTREG